MKILVVHNKYILHGGEDSVVDSEVELLRSKGNEVLTYFRSNEEIANPYDGGLVVGAFWSRRTVRDFERLFDAFKPDLIHVHNTVPLISPSIYWIADRLKIPVVQTLHNFRLMCLGAMYLRDGDVCEDCLGKAPWRGVVHKCYRNSYISSAVLAGALSLHRYIGTYQNKVSRYIALNEFCRAKFLEGGIPDRKIVVKPNFVSTSVHLESSRDDFLFVGRLSIEKGVDCLVKAILLRPDIKIRVAGDGPCSCLLDGINSVMRLGHIASSAVLQEMSSVLAVIVPSVCYETFGLVVIEAYSRGTPVIASRTGALAELVIEGETGLLFSPGDHEELAKKIEWAKNNRDKMGEMGVAALRKFSAEFSSEKNYSKIMQIYTDAINEVAKRT